MKTIVLSTSAAERTIVPGIGEDIVEFYVEGRAVTKEESEALALGSFEAAKALLIAACQPETLYITNRDSLQSANCEGNSWYSWMIVSILGVLPDGSFCRCAGAQQLEGNVVYRPTPLDGANDIYRDPLDPTRCLPRMGWGRFWQPLNREGYWYHAPLNRDGTYKEPEYMTEAEAVAAIAVSKAINKDVINKLAKQPAWR